MIDNKLSIELMKKLDSKGHRYLFYVTKFLCDYKELELKYEENENLDVYTYVYKSQPVIVLEIDRTNNQCKYSLDYYNRLISSFTGIAKVLNKLALEGFTNVTNDNAYLYIKGIIQCSLVSLKYPGIKAKINEEYK